MPYKRVETAGATFGDVVYETVAPGGGGAAEYVGGGWWVHQFFLFQSGSTNPNTGLNYESGDTIDLYLMDYSNLHVGDNTGFILKGAT
jgi:hypothetical protein